MIDPAKKEEQDQARIDEEIKRFNREWPMSWYHDYKDAITTMTAAALSNGGELRIQDRDMIMAPGWGIEVFKDEANRTTVIRAVKK